MSVRLAQWFMYGVEVSFEDAEKLGFDEDFWEHLDSGEVDYKTLPNGVDVVTAIESGKYYFGEVLFPESRYDGTVLSTLLKDLSLTVDGELLIDMALQELKIEGKAEYRLITTFD